MFYVYKWYNTLTQEIFYIGKGCNNRYKSLKSRNHLFLEYYYKNPCNVEIIAYFEKEEDALLFEHEKIISLKQQNQCFCNLDNGGTGGLNFVWTEEMRKNKSINNPMKKEEQKERMRNNNPMKNEETKNKVVKKKTNIVIYGEEETTAKDLAKRFSVTTASVYYWIKKKKDPRGVPCFFKNKKDSDGKRCKGIHVIVDGKEFPSYSQAAKFLGDTHSDNLIRAMKNGYTEYKGHICEYANQQPSDTNSDKSSIEGSTTNG